MFRSLPQYDVIRTEEIPDIKSTGTLLRHKKSGARVMLLENKDENKVFNICFRTPPADSTGVAHILEHSVLCGSRKFPSRDPFVELAKGSLNTFLNAMTYPDKTMYPVASCNFADFCNLMHVYMDAVLFPNIYEKEEIFRQEGWSYILENPEDELIYNGVVYNEMKGVFSTPDDVLEREIMNTLFPDTPYGVESGGDPKVIPDLKYSEFLSFHSRYYHPSNSYIYLYGDMDMEERLAWLDREYLCKYDAMEIDSQIPLQKPFEKPVELVKAYPISNTDEESDNSYLAWSVAAGTVHDARLSMAMAVLEYVLLSAPGAPLKQALLDAGIGKDVEGSYDSGILQPVFSVIVKFTNPDKKEEFVRIVRETLRKLAEEGLEEKAVLAAINNMEFRSREADFGRFPKGLMYGINAFDSWLYDEDAPFDYLRELEIYQFLKEQVGTRYFEELIQKYLLDNTHASVILMVPEKGLTDKEDARVREKLAAYKVSLSGEEIEDLIARTKRLRKFQETPSTEEELEKIPLLELSDIKKETAPLYNRKIDVNGTALVYHEIDTNGIAYLNLLFEIPGLPDEMLPYLGILRSVLGKVDTKEHGYRELNNEINIYSGGIHMSLDTFQNAGEPEKYSTKFTVRSKMLYEQIDRVFDMIEEILFTSSLEDGKRLYEILAQTKSDMQASLAWAGNMTAATRATAYISGQAHFQDATGGIDYYRELELLESRYEECRPQIVSNLKKLIAAIFCRDNLMVSLTAEPEALGKIQARVAGLREKLPQTEQAAGRKTAPLGKKNEGFTTSGQVQFVAMAGNFRPAGEYTGALHILKTIMAYEYLWTNIRVQGGAYGCMSGYRRTGETYFVSYRDPNLGRTVGVYEGIAEYLRNFTVSDRDMKKYIIGTMSEIDTPLGPSLQGARSMTAFLTGVTLSDLQRERDEVLNAAQEDIRALAPLVDAVVRERNICVVGGEAKIRAEKELFLEIRPLVGQGGQE